MTGLNDTVGLWIRKAENDLKAGKGELSSENPATDTVCFHAQQCAEKYLKGYLILSGIEIEKTHHIGKILNRCKEQDDEFSILLENGANKLTAYAVELRYPDDYYMPDVEETRAAMEIAEGVKRFVLRKMSELGFEPEIFLSM